MTLVVARASSAGIRVLSDTRVDNPRSTRRLPHQDDLPRPLNGALKTVILNPLQCVCFAGRLDCAQSAVRSLFENRLHVRADDGIILDHLLQAHLSSDGETDFLLGSLIGGRPSLSEISCGRVERNRQAAWLGSAEAFERYQRAYHSERPRLATDESDSQVKQRMTNAFSQLMFEGAIDDVGDFLIDVKTAPEGLAYAWHACVMPAKQEFTSDDWEPMSSGGIADGGYAYSVLCPPFAGLPFVAIYVVTSGLGLVFSPLHSDAAQEFRAATPEKFVDAIERQFGIRPRGWIFDGDSGRPVR